MEMRNIAKMLGH